MALSRNSYELFDLVFNSTKDRLYSFVLKHTRDEHRTEEVLQHCYMKLWENIADLDPSRADRLLFTYARHRIIDLVRKQQASIITFRAVEEDHLSAPAEVEMRIVDQQVQTLIDRMPPKRKQVFVLVRKHGLSYDEVSEQLGISKLTIKKHMNEALRFLRESDE